MTGSAPGSRSRLKVVYVDHVARLSGGEIALLRLLPALSEFVEAHVILAEDGPLADRLRSAGITVEVLEMDPALKDLRKGAVHTRGLHPRNALLLISYILRLRRRLIELRPALIHTNSLKSAIYGGFAGRLARIPVVWHMRDRIARDYLPGPAVSAIRVLSVLLPTAIVGNSRSTLQTLPRFRRSRVIYGAVVHDVIPGVQAVAQRDSGVLRIGMVGRLAEWKGQHVFLKAFAKGCPPNSEAWIIGAPLFGEDDYVARLKDLTTELDLTDRVIWRGFRENIPQELGMIDILVHASITPEPFGQVVVEGMAAGLPVIASDAGGPGEVISDEIDGLLVSPGDDKALSIALQRLSEDPQLRSRLGDMAVLSSRRFRPETAAEELRALYESLRL